jgi:hypothetical protein
MSQKMGRFAMLRCTLRQRLCDGIKNFLLFRYFYPKNRKFLEILLIESRVGEVDVLLVHALLSQGDRFAKAIGVEWKNGVFQPNFFKLGLHFVIGCGIVPYSSQSELLKICERLLGW